MSSFASYDGTEISYRVLGDGPPLVCLPGGPGRAAGYLGDLGGLGASRQLVLLGVSERHQAAREGFFDGASFDAPATRAAPWGSSRRPSCCTRGNWTRW
jgi:pimeloyl-ACP methyl ester carboxylesterase